MSKLNWEQKDAVYFILHSSDGVLLRGPTPDGGEGWVWFEGDTWWCCPINGAPVTEVTAARLAMSILIDLN